MAAPGFPSPAPAGFQQFPGAEAQRGPAAASLHKNHLPKAWTRGCLLPDYPGNDFCLSGQQLGVRNAPRSLQIGIVPSQECLFEPVLRTVDNECQTLAFIIITKLI